MLLIELPSDFGQLIYLMSSHFPAPGTRFIEIIHSSCQSGIYTAPLTAHPQNQKYPQASRNVPTRGALEVYKMKKIMADWRKMDKNQFSIEIFRCKFLNFLKNFKS